ncbi:hypothetical protein C8R44DRAFT_891243 [Mycena epipterygia]|nr:hypothetical protein C8R44DRAFT_891243 [Mycena epipterygia]
MYQFRTHARAAPSPLSTTPQSAPTPAAPPANPRVIPTPTSQSQSTSASTATPTAPSSDPRVIPTPLSPSAPTHARPADVAHVTHRRVHVPAVPAVPRAARPLQVLIRRPPPSAASSASHATSNSTSTSSQRSAGRFLGLSKDKEREPQRIREAERGAPAPQSSPRCRNPRRTRRSTIAWIARTPARLGARPAQGAEHLEDAQEPSEGTAKLGASTSNKGGDSGGSTGTGGGASKTSLMDKAVRYLLGEDAAPDRSAEAIWLMGVQLPGWGASRRGAGGGGGGARALGILLPMDTARRPRTGCGSVVGRLPRGVLRADVMHVPRELRADPRPALARHAAAARGHACVRGRARLFLYACVADVGEWQMRSPFPVFLLPFPGLIFVLFSSGGSASSDGSASRSHSASLPSLNTHPPHPLIHPPSFHFSLSSSTPHDA